MIGLGCSVFRLLPVCYLKCYLIFSSTLGMEGMGRERRRADLENGGGILCLF